MGEYSPLSSSLNEKISKIEPQKPEILNSHEIPCEMTI